MSCIANQSDQNFFYLGEHSEGLVRAYYWKPAFEVSLVAFNFASEDPCNSGR